MDMNFNTENYSSQSNENYEKFRRDRREGFHKDAQSEEYRRKKKLKGKNFYAQDSKRKNKRSNFGL